MTGENATRDEPAPDPARTLASGDRVGEYVLEALIGRGRFGDVWRGRHAVLPGRTVAVKLPRDPSLLELLGHRGLGEHGFEHPGLLRILGVDLASDPPYVAEEYASGGDLAGVLENDGPLPLDEAMTIFHDVVRVVAAAHARGVVHGDLKPGNILFDSAGHARVADFGLGRGLRTLLDREHRDRPRTRESFAAVPFGSAWEYLSPEARDWALRKPNAGRPDARADIYALGVILHELLTGGRPQGRVDLRRISPEIDRIFARSWTALENRYRDARELLSDLDRLRSRVRPRRKSSRRSRRARRPVDYRGSSILWQRAIVLTPLLLIGALVYFFWVRGDAPWRRRTPRGGTVEIAPVLSEDARKLASIHDSILAHPSDMRAALALLGEFIVIAKEDVLREKALAWREALSAADEPQSYTVHLRRVAIDRESYRRREDARLEPGYPDVFVRVLQSRDGGAEREIFSTRKKPIEAWAHNWSGDDASSHFTIEWRSGDKLRVEILDADLFKDDLLDEIRVDGGYSILLLSRLSMGSEGHQVHFESDFPFGG